MSSCLVCEHKNLDFVRPYRAKTPHGQTLFQTSSLQKCLQCGVVQATPRPRLQSLEEYYSIDYRDGCFAGSDVADLENFPHDNLYYYNRGQSIAELLSTYLNTEQPNVLDIGAGFGHILYALGERYPQGKRSAIEFSQVCVEHLRSIGIEVSTQPAEEALAESNEMYDLIILSHVFEHLWDPSLVLRLIHERLTPNGILYIEVPNIPEEALDKYIDSVWAPRFDEPHLTFFSQEPLAQLLKEHNFNVEFCKTAGKEYKYISALQFRLPHWRWFLQGITPEPVFHFLRNLRATNAIKVQAREESFYEYDGFRIWIRSISRKVEPKGKRL